MIHSLKLQHPIRVAIDGIDGAGKTSMADELVEPLTALGRPVIRASVDGFHRPRAERYRRGEASPEGYYRDSFDNAALTSALLEPLGPAGDRRFRTAIFDYRSEGPVSQRVRTADRRAVLLFDGVFLLRPELVRSWDFTIFVKTDIQYRTRARGISRLVVCSVPAPPLEIGTRRVTNPGSVSTYAEAQPGAIRRCRDHQ